MHEDSDVIALNGTLWSCDVYPSKVATALQYNTNIIAKIGIASSTLSLVGSSSILLFTVRKRLLNHTQLQPLIHLSLADFILSSVWIISTLKYFFGTQYSHPSSTAVFCFVCQLLAELFHLATFFLTVNYAVHVYLRMWQRSAQVRMINDAQLLRSHVHVKRMLYVVAWTAPFLLLMPIFVNIKLDHINACQRCVILIDVPVLVGRHLTWAYGYIVLALSLTFSTVAIIVIYASTLRLYWKAVPGFRTNHERRQLANMQSRVTMYMIVFIVCWSPALMISYHKWISHSSFNKHHGVDVNQFFWLYVFQAVCAPLQGLANSVVYGWSRKHFRSSPEIPYATTLPPGDGTPAPCVDFTSSVSLSDDEEYSGPVNTDASLDRVY